MKKEKQSKLSGSTPFQRIWDQMKKEFKLLKTDKINLFIALLLPPLVIALFSSMVHNAIPNFNIQGVIVSYDSNAYVAPNNYTQTVFDNYTAPFIQAAHESKLFNISNFGWYNATEDIYAMNETQALLTAGKIQVIIVLPADFTELLMSGLPGLINSVVDASNIKAIQNILNAVQDVVNIFDQNENFTGQFNLTGSVINEFNNTQNPTDLSELGILTPYSSQPGPSFTFNYAISLVLGFVIFAVSCILTILVVVQEQTIPRLLLTPVKRTEILTSKFLTYSIILILQIIFILVAASLNGLVVYGSMFQLFIGMFVMGYVGSFWVFSFRPVSKTKMEANQLFFAFFIVLLLFSGIFIPVSSMPVILQLIANILPLAHGSPMIQAIISNRSSVWGSDLLYLVIQGIFLTVVSYILIKRKDYEV